MFTGTFFRSKSRELLQRAVCKQLLFAVLAVDALATVAAQCGQWQGGLGDSLDENEADLS